MSASRIRFQRNRPTTDIYFLICFINSTFFGYLPSSISFWHFTFQCFLQPIQHANALFVTTPKFSIYLFGDIPFKLRHEQVVYRFSSFASAAIHPLYFVADMAVIIFLCQLSGRTVGGPSHLTPQFITFPLLATYMSDRIHQYAIGTIAYILQDPPHLNSFL